MPPLHVAGSLHPQGCVPNTQNPLINAAFAGDAAECWAQRMPSARPPSCTGCSAGGPAARRPAAPPRAAPCPPARAPPTPPAAPGTAVPRARCARAPCTCQAAGAPPAQPAALLCFQCGGRTLVGAVSGSRSCSAKCALPRAPGIQSGEHTSVNNTSGQFSMLGRLAGKQAIKQGKAVQQASMLACKCSA